MPNRNSPNIREVLLQVIEEQQPSSPTGASLQTDSILREASRRLNATNNRGLEEAILTQWYEFFNTGYLAWGLNLSNPNPPFFHLTEQGRQTLSQYSRDPANPDGYIRHLYDIADLNQIAKSYIEEGLECYVRTLYKAAAVMTGAASEAIILELRDIASSKLEMLGRSITRDLKDRSIKNVLKGLKALFENEKRNFSNNLREEYESYWSAFTQQIRAVRNDAGHPTSVEPVTPETIHGSLLIFPELAKLASRLKEWIENEMT